MNCVNRINPFPLEGGGLGWGCDANVLHGVWILPPPQPSPVKGEGVYKFSFLLSGGGNKMIAFPLKGMGFLAYFVLLNYEIRFTRYKIRDTLHVRRFTFHKILARTWIVRYSMRPQMRLEIIRFSEGA